MMTFFDLFHVKKYEEALDIIVKIKVSIYLYLIPLNLGNCSYFKAKIIV